MTNQEEESIIKIAGKNYSYQDIPTFIKERDNLPKPSVPNAPYWKDIESPSRFDGESVYAWINRQDFSNERESELQKNEFENKE